MKRALFGFVWFCLFFLGSFLVVGLMRYRCAESTGRLTDKQEKNMARIYAESDSSGRLRWQPSRRTPVFFLGQDMLTAEASTNQSFPGRPLTPYERGQRFGVAVIGWSVLGVAWWFTKRKNRH